MRDENVIAVVMASSAATSSSEILSIMSTFAVSLMCILANKNAKAAPATRPMAIPKAIEMGIFINLITDVPPPCIMDTKVENRTITYTSSTDAPASISCGMPSLVP